MAAHACGLKLTEHYHPGLIQKLFTICKADQVPAHRYFDMLFESTTLRYLADKDMSNCDDSEHSRVQAFYIEDFDWRIWMAQRSSTEAHLNGLDKLSECLANYKDVRESCWTIRAHH